MYLEDFERIVTRLEEDVKVGENYLNELRLIDSSILDAVLENKYTNMVCMQLDFLHKELFGEELYDWVCWYLFDKTIDEKAEVHYNGVIYEVTDIKSFVLFAEHGLKLPMRPKLGVNV